MGDTGRRDRVMVACVVEDVVMIVKPAKAYGVDRIHLISYVKKGNDEASRKREGYYQSFLDAVEGDLTKAGIPFEVHPDAETYKFDMMMGVIYNIVRKERARNSIVYVNTSGGTSEYAAAAMLVSMMFDETTAFNVGGKREASTVDYDAMRESRTSKGKLVGKYADVYDPFKLTTFPVSPPDLNLLAGMKVLDSIPLKKRTNAEVVRKMIECGVWRRFKPDRGRDERIEDTSLELAGMDSTSARASVDPEEFKKRKNKELKQYASDYLQKWEENGWVEKDPTSYQDRYSLTVAGRTILGIFCPDDVFKVNESRRTPRAGSKDLLGREMISNLAHSVRRADRTTNRQESSDAEQPCEPVH